MNPIISLVLCTYNNADSLKATLTQLAKQRLLNPEEVEIIVVNNNSSDHTQTIAESTNFGLIKYQCFAEPQQGLSNARNLGVAKAQGDYILFTDDDAEINSDWMQTYIDHIKKNLPDCLFGKIEIIWDKPKPWWYDDRYQGFFAAIDHGDRAFTVTTWRNPFFGKNFCVKKHIVIGAGGFDPELGRKGTELLGGEESAVFNYLLSHKKNMWYYPDIPVGHRLKAREYTVEHITKQYLACAKPIVWLSLMGTGPKIFGRDISILRNHIVFILEHGTAYLRAKIHSEKKDEFFFSLEFRRAIKVVVYWLRTRKT